MVELEEQQASCAGQRQRREGAAGQRGMAGRRVGHAITTSSFEVDVGRRDAAGQEAVPGRVDERLGAEHDGHPLGHVGHRGRAASAAPKGSSCGERGGRAEQREHAAAPGVEQRLQLVEVGGLRRERAR